MSFWPCDGPSCAKHALFLRGDCSFCGKHFCAEHIHTTEVCEQVDRHTSIDSHKQYEVDCDEMEVLLQRLDVPMILSQALALRPGFICSVPHLSPTIDDVEGYPGSGMNFHIPLTWNDGAEWLVRVRRKRQIDPPPGAKAMVLKSEVATVKAMREGGTIGPEAFLPPTSIFQAALDPYSLHYFFVERMPGENTNYFNYDPDGPPEPFFEAFIMSFAKWTISLSNLSFDQVGSLTFDEEGKVIIGPVMEHFALDPKAPFYHGPFKTAQDRYIDLFETIMKHIVNGDWCTSPSDTVHEYLTFLEAKTLVEGCEELGRGPYYLQHGDPSCYQFLSHPGGELTAVLDWEWARLTSKGDAFAAWCALLSWGFWEQGSNDLTEYELLLAASYEKLGRPDLAQCVRQGKKYQRLQQLTKYNYEPQEFDCLNALRRAFLDIPDGKAANEPKTDLDWDLQAIDRYKDDATLQSLLERFPLDLRKDQ